MQIQIAHFRCVQRHTWPDRSDGRDDGAHAADFARVLIERQDRPTRSCRRGGDPDVLGGQRLAVASQFVPRTGKCRGS